MPMERSGVAFQHTRKKFVKKNVGGKKVYFGSMQDGSLDKKVQQYTVNGHNEPPGTVVQTIKSSEFNKLDQTRS